MTFFRHESDALAIAPAARSRAVFAQWRTSMNVTSVIRIFAGVAALLVFWSSGARAQSEVNPDQFDSPNTEHFPQPKVKESAVVVTEQRFSGMIMLPYTLESAGKKVIAGH